MRNTIIWHFEGPSQSQAICRLQENNIITVKAWIGLTDKCKYCTHDFRRFSEVKKPFMKILGNGPEVHDKLQKFLGKFVETYARNFGYYNVAVEDYPYIFNMFISFFSEIIANNNIHLVIFDDVPHGGAAFVLYEVARSLGIRTLILSQALFPNKFLYIEQIKEYGNFPNMDTVFPNPWITLPKQHEKNLCYMKEEPKQRLQSLRAFYNSISNGGDLGALAKTISRNLPLELLYKAALLYDKYYRQKIYLRNLKKNFNDPPNFQSRYVYFALHLQPEMTTSMLGDLYEDQAIAIERLARFVGPDCNIYVKENPKQDFHMRSQWFIDRLRQISNVKLISPQIDTYALTKHSLFVATITGTVGWEAITGGKNALIFGRAWYKNLPGVFYWEDGASFNDINAYRIAHKSLEKQFNDFLLKLPNGVIDPTRECIVEGFSAEANAEVLTESLKKIIEQK